MSQLDDILAGFPEPMRADITERIMDLVLNRALDHAHANLSEDKQRQFDELAAKNNVTHAEIEYFLEANLPNFNAIVVEEAMKLREEIEGKLAA